MAGPVLGPLHPVVAENLTILRSVSKLDEVSFHMSSTEAVMAAVRLARFNAGSSSCASRAPITAGGTACSRDSAANGVWTTASCSGTSTGRPLKSSGAEGLGVTRLMPSMDSTPEWNVVMAAALVAMLPPVVIVLLLQRWFVRGLVEADK